MMVFKEFPFYRQLEAVDCGPTCLKMISKFHGRNFRVQALREKCHINREGVSLLGISDAAESVGFKTLAARIPFDKLKEEAPFPLIAHWKQEHFVVVYKCAKGKVYVADPAYGLVKFSEKEFVNAWTGGHTSEGVVLLLEPTPEFFNAEDEQKSKTGFRYVFSYFLTYKKYLFQLLLGLFTGSIIQLIFPFLTQVMVDSGIVNQDINFIYLILSGQLMLYFSKAAVEYFRRWILLHISARINITIISDFLLKLTRLPVSWFDSKMTGDLLQRIGDHKRIESFLTSSTLNVVFSGINILVFGLVLAFYHLPVFLLFLGGSLLYALWIFIFLKQRRVLDNKRFSQLSSGQSNLIQFITGMQEIKLNNCEKKKRWEWEYIQARLFRLNIKSMALEQHQEIGSVFINEIKNILITFLTAKAVIDGQISLGAMLAVQYIIGQLNSPVNQMIDFIRSAQDAKLSLLRLGEVHDREDEDAKGLEYVTRLPADKSLTVSGLTFRYGGPHSEAVLKDINLEIPEGKITAIVGTSGSGKTTLLKLLLKFYKLSPGTVRAGNIDLNNFSSRFWRSQCGVVMQDGFIFSDTIAANIAPGDEIPDREKLFHAVTVANIRGFVESLPLGYNTKIGAEGTGLSQGQKQRILIARAVYKDPAYIFLDEATNALDANNEKIIMNNLEEFFKGRTVIVVAHRLSTVRNAHQVITLDKGKLIECGSHQELIDGKGAYYHLVKNQLELGN
ncbi:peptidase domain-containing ABC transporter [Cytophagaceae bacterium ABcell3]|nr:peptidase domain-containing ABC transporter [Cytophagaceae bacterium ABcell3]